MKINVEKTHLYFDDSICDKYYDFLKRRNIRSKSYIQALKDGKYGILEDNTILIEEEEYMVTYILGSSKESIYDLIRVNQFYDLDPKEGTAFAILLGDDFLFFMPNDEKIYFFCRDTEEIKEVAADYDSFINLIQFQGE